MPAAAEVAPEDNVLIEVFDRDGNLKEKRELHNLIPTVGKEAIAKILKEGSTRPSHMAVGSGSEGPAAGDTKLKTEVDRNALASTTVTAKVFEAVGEWATGEATGEIKEAGMFSASSEGTLFTRAVFSVINKGAEDTLKITWKITVE